MKNLIISKGIFIFLLFNLSFITLLAQANYELNIIDEDANENLYDAKVADLDGDGNLDIIFSNEDGVAGGIWYKNLGDGSYEKIEIATDVNIRDLEPYDVDQDGDVDLFYNSETQTTDGSYVESGWFENDGNGNFQKQVYLDSRNFTAFEKGRLENEDQLVVVDINGDGLIDVSLSLILEDNPTQGRSLVSYAYLQNPDHTFTRTFIETWSRQRNEEFWNTGFGLSPGDINGDGLIDFGFQRYVEEEFYWIQKGEGTLWGDSQFDNADYFPGQWLNLFDVDGDGDLDGYAFGDGDGGPFYQENDGEGNFTRVYNSEVFSWPRAPRIDFDGDGDLDGFENGAYWEENLGDFTFEERLIDERLIDYTVDILDLDGDGDMDILQHGNDETTLTLWENKENEDNGSSGPFGFECKQIEMGSLQYPDNAELADIDGDGLLDLYIGTVGQISTLSGTGTSHVAWYKNLGNGEYKKHAVYALNVLGSFLSDFDKDGDVDILYGSTFGEAQNQMSKYAVLINDGTGIFNEEIVVDLIEQARVTDLHIVDLNQDGLMDFYVETDRLEWYRNGPTTYTTGDREARVDAYYNLGNLEFDRTFIESYRVQRSDEVRSRANHGDFNGDGYIDIVVHFLDDAFDEHLIYYCENRDGESFRSEEMPDINYQSFGDILVEDVDGDGDLDFGRFLEFQDNIWFINDGAGDFSIMDNNTRFFPIEIDFDGDGDIDRMNTQGIIWQENIDNEYLDTDVFSVPGIEDFTKTSFFDIDNDGDVDIVYSDPSRTYTQDYIHVAFNDGNQNFDEQTTIDGYHYQPENLKTVDLDLDGDLDLIVAHSTEEEFYWYENDGNQNFTRTYILDRTREMIEVENADFDLDGDLDFITIELGYNSKLRFWENDGAMNFSADFLDGDLLGSPNNIEILDFNMDAYPDFIVSDTVEDHIVLYTNDQNGDFVPSVLLESVEARSMVLIDLQNNGFQDLIVADALSNELIYYRNNEGSGFQRFERGNTAGFVDHMKVEDIDDDGDYDIISASYPRQEVENDNGEVVLWLNDGTNNFNKIVLSNSGNWRAITCGDYDVDGDLDIIVSAYNVLDNGLTLFEQNGFLDFIEKEFDNNFFNGSSLISTDLDGNGSTDIIGASNGMGIKWWQNTEGTSSVNLALACPEDVTLETTSLNTIVNYDTPTLMADCPVGAEVNVISGPASGDLFDIGTTQVVFEAIDNCGTEAVRCTVNFEIQLFAALELECIPDVIAYTEGNTTNVSWAEPTFITECYDQEVVIIQTEGPSSGSEFPLGLTTISYEATSACNSEATCSFNIFVEQEPTLEVICSDDITISTSGQNAVVNWDEPTFETTCLDDELITILQVEGLPSGSEFPIGTTTITYEVSNECDNIETCSFDVTVEQDDIGPTDGCPENIQGFQSLGSWNGHNYYLSNSIQNWRDAEMSAHAIGGHLVSIGSEEENDFLADQINELAFIGYQDANSEGNFVWSNGEALSYENLLAFNSTYADYAYMNFWDGSWNLSGRFTERKFIVEINCDTYVSCSLSANINSLDCDETAVSFEMTVEAFGESTEWVAFINGEEYNGEYGVTTSFGPFPINEIGEGLSFFVEDGLSDCSTLVEYFLPDCPTTVINCPQEVEGYSLLGEYNGSKYFISDILTTWMKANEMAKDQGTNLVSINDQEENSFLQNNIFELVFIGLNDQDNEGSLTWSSGEALSYTNYADCFFCNENSEERDYAHMNFWDGAWSFDGPFTERRHVIEFECSSNSSPGIMPRLAFDSSLAKTEIQLYPNPVLNELNIEIDAIEDLEEEILIYDARGALLSQRNVSLIRGNNKIQINMDDYPNAMYLIKFAQLNDLRKFIKKD